MKPKRPESSLLNTSECIRIADFQISNRTKNTLINSGLETLAAIEDLYEEELKGLGIGDKGIFELKQYLKFTYKVSIQKKPKPKLPNFKEARETVNHFLSHSKKINWPKELKTASNLIEKYGFQKLLEIPPSKNIWSLSFFFLPDGKKYIENNSKITKVIVEEKVEIPVEETERIEYKKVEKPKSIKDFLGI